MVRQGHLESLVDSDNSDMPGDRAVIQFIDHFLGTVRESLHSVLTNADTTADPNQNDYMDLSPDLDTPEGLTQ